MSVLNEDSLRTIIESKLPLVKAPKVYIGIHTFIDNHLCNGKQFKPKHVDCRDLWIIARGIRQSLMKEYGTMAGNGMTVGCMLDSALKKYTTQKEVLGNTKSFQVAHHHGFIKNRLRQVIAALKEYNVELVMSDIPVYCDKSKIRTRIDAVGYNNKTKTVVVVELKATATYTRELLQKCYDTSCTNQAKMTSGVTNSERTRHIIQTQFATEAFKKIYGIKRVASCVVYSCLNGTMVYELQHTRQLCTFNAPSRGATARKQKSDCFTNRKNWDMESIAPVLRRRGVPINTLQKSTSNISRTKKAWLKKDKAGHMVGVVSANWDALSSEKQAMYKNKLQTARQKATHPFFAWVVTCRRGKWVAFTV